VAVTVVSLLAACAGPVTRGGTLYTEGRYVDAASVLESAEREVVTASPSERATYGLYRGMTLLALGDLRGAERWLSVARRLQARDAEVLSPSESELLDAGERAVLRARERRAAEHRAATAPSSVAAVEPPPPAPASATANP